MTAGERVRLLRSMGMNIHLSSRQEVRHGLVVKVCQVWLVRDGREYANTVRVPVEAERWVIEHEQHECITSVMKKAGIS